MTNTQIPIFLDLAGKKLSLFYAILHSIWVVLSLILFLFVKPKDKKNQTAQENEKKGLDKFVSLTMFITSLITLPIAWGVYYFANKYPLFSQISAVLYFISILGFLFSLSSTKTED